MLTGLAGSVWREDAEKVSLELGIDICVHTIGPGQVYVDSWGDYAKISEIDESGMLLVRPDKFIAWRAPDAAQAGSGKLLEVMRSLLAID